MSRPSPLLPRGLPGGPTRGPTGAIRCLVGGGGPPPARPAGEARGFLSPGAPPPHRTLAPPRLCTDPEDLHRPGGRRSVPRHRGRPRGRNLRLVGLRPPRPLLRLLAGRRFAVGGRRGDGGLRPDRAPRRAVGDRRGVGSLYLAAARRSRSREPHRSGGGRGAGAAGAPRPQPLPGALHLPDEHRRGGVPDPPFRLRLLAARCRSSTSRWGWWWCSICW